jgi:hypothetical protein
MPAASAANAITIMHRDDRVDPARPRRPGEREPAADQPGHDQRAEPRGVEVGRRQHRRQPAEPGEHQVGAVHQQPHGGPGQRQQPDVEHRLAGRPRLAPQQPQARVDRDRRREQQPRDRQRGGHRPARVDARDPERQQQRRGRADLARRTGPLGHVHPDSLRQGQGRGAQRDEQHDQLGQRRLIQPRRRARGDHREPHDQTRGGESAELHRRRRLPGHWHAR